MAWWTGRLVPESQRRLPFAAEQRATLVNVKLKWVKDRALDAAVARDRHLRPAHGLVALISSSPGGRATARNLSGHRRRLSGLPPSVPIRAFLHRFPALFRESSAPGATGGSRAFALTDAAIRLRAAELLALSRAEPDLLSRLRRLLMLTSDRALPLHTIDQLSWDVGLPQNYTQTLIPCYPELFAFFQPPGDERVWLKLKSWDPNLAISELQKGAVASGGEKDGNLAFPVSFTRGFGLKKKCMDWLREWQTLPYTSPYSDASCLDPRTDVAEKRIVGVFHELLHLTIAKKTERRNVSNLRRPLGLPQKFTKVFERHPGIFYLSQKLATQTVVLREAYGGGRELLVKHPLVEIREKYVTLMRAGMPERRGRSPKEVADSEDGDDAHPSDAEQDDESDGCMPAEESDGSCHSDSENDSDDMMDAHCS